MGGEGVPLGGEGAPLGGEGAPFDGWGAQLDLAFCRFAMHTSWFLLSAIMEAVEWGDLGAGGGGEADLPDLGRFGTQFLRNRPNHDVLYSTLLPLSVKLAGPNLGRVPGGGGVALVDFRGTQLVDMVEGKGGFG